MNKDKSIKDLKQYNDKLKNQLECSKIRVWSLERKNNELQQRIEKAVEYIKEMDTQLEVYGDYDILSDNKNDLLNILNGRSDE